MKIDRPQKENRRSHSNSQGDLKLKQEAQKLGVIGTILGAGENAALYIAGTVLIIALLMLGVVMLVDENLRPEIVKTIGTIGIAAFGYIGGIIKARR